MSAAVSKPLSVEVKAVVTAALGLSGCRSVQVWGSGRRLSGRLVRGHLGIQGRRGLARLPWSFCSDPSQG